jgi:hypothetical protein
MQIMKKEKEEEDDIIINSERNEDDKNSACDIIKYQSDIASNLIVNASFAKHSWKSGGINTENINKFDDLQSIISDKINNSIILEHKDNTLTRSVNSLYFNNDTSSIHSAQSYKPQSTSYNSQVINADVYRNGVSKLSMPQINSGGKIKMNTMGISMLHQSPVKPHMTQSTPINPGKLAMSHNKFTNKHLLKNQFEDEDEVN